jgi:hypothetical protein
MLDEVKSAASPDAPTTDPNVAKSNTENLPLYALSTQFRHWRFEKKELSKLRFEANQRSIENARSIIQEEARLQVCS